MFCTNCGNQIADGQNFCMSCGSQVTSAQPQYNQMAYQQPQQNAYVQPQQYAQQNMYGQSAYPQQNTYTVAQPKTTLGMGWFNFIIWVQLFLNAAVNVRTGVMALTGAQYEVDGYGNVADTVYRYFENLKIYDTAYGSALIMLAVFAILVRFRLSGYKKNGPMSYIILLGANIVIPLVYAFLAAEELDASIGEVLEGSEANIIGCIILFFVNIFYFNNRKHMFTK